MTVLINKNKVCRLNRKAGNWKRREEIKDYKSDL